MNFILFKMTISSYLILFLSCEYSSKCHYILKPFHYSCHCSSKLQQCPGLAFTNLKQHSGSFLPPPLGTKNSLHILGHMSNSKYGQSDYFGRSYASVAASHKQSRLFSMNDNLVMPSSGGEVYFPSHTGDHNHVNNTVSSSRNEMTLPKQEMKDLSLAMPYVGICHSTKTCSLDHVTATKTNLVAEDSIYRPSFLDYHMSEGIIGEPFLSYSDGNSQLSKSQADVRTHASADCLNSMANTENWNCESLENVAKKKYSERDDLGAVSRRSDPFLSLQTLPGDSTSIQQNALPSYNWSRLHSELGYANISSSFEDESLSSSLSKKSKDFSVFSTIPTNSYHILDKPSTILPTEPMLFHGVQKNLCRSSSTISPTEPMVFHGVQKNLCISSSSSCSDTVKTRDEKFLNQLRPDLGSAKFRCSFEDGNLSSPFSTKLKDFSTFSTISTNFYHKLDKPSAILPTEPMLFHAEQKNLCSRSSCNSGPDFEFVPIDRTRDEKFLIESYVEQCEDSILSDILTLDLDAFDDPGDTHSILEQLDSSGDLSRLSNSSLPPTMDPSKSYFSMMDDLNAAVGQLYPWSNSVAGLTKNSSNSETGLTKSSSNSEIIKEKAYMKDSFNKFYLETLNSSKVLNNTSLLSSTVVSDSGSSLGSSLSQPISQHPYSNSALRTTLSSPPGFPPRKTNPGSTPQIQPHSSSSARCFSNTKATSSSHTEKITSSATSRNNSSQHLFFHQISNNQELLKDQFNSVSSNAVDFEVFDRNQPTLTTISTVVPEFQNRLNR